MLLLLLLLLLLHRPRLARLKTRGIIYPCEVW